MLPERGQRRQPRTRRRIVFRIVAILLATGAALAVAEGALRLFGSSYRVPVSTFFDVDSELGYRGKACHTGRFRQEDFDVEMIHDCLGFRRHEHPGPDAPARDVYVLGDSFTWGFGVGQGRVYTDLMNQQLTRFKMHNFGLCASGTVQQYALFNKHVRPNLEPRDVVFVAFYVNDYEDNVGRSGLATYLHAEIRGDEIREVPPSRLWLGRIKKTLNESSHVVNLMSSTWGVFLKQARDRKREAREKDISSAPPVDNPGGGNETHDVLNERPEMIVTVHYLQKFRDACGEAQARLVVVYIPDACEYGEHACSSLGPQAEMRQTLLSRLEELGIETLDMTPAIRDAKDRDGGERLTFPHDHHWNEAGHRLAADVLSRFLEREVSERP